MKTICIADIESTAIPSEGVLAVEQIHCIAVKSGDLDTMCYTSRFLPLSNYGGTLQNGLDAINSHDTVLFHNYTFDVVVLEQLLGKVTATPLDTMLLAKLIYTSDELRELDYTLPDMPKALYGRFSLAAFGYRLGLHKGDYSDWSRLTVEMCDYCSLDVEVTYHLYYSLLGVENFPSQSTIDLEHEVAYIITQQTHYGFYYDVDGARELQQSLMYEKLSIELRLSKTFRSLFLADGPPIVPAKARRNKLYIPDLNYTYLDSISYFPFQWKTTKKGKTVLRGPKTYHWTTTPHRLVYGYTDGEYVKIKLTKFEPGSRHKIRHWLKTMYGFTFSTFTNKGNAKVNGDELEFLGDRGSDLMRYLKVVKDLSEARSGIENTREHSHSIHGRVDTIGAATHRATHSKPNVAQTSKDNAFRKLYTTPPGMTLVGADLANIEVRVLAHYLYPYDGGKYAEAVLSKDMHWYHAKLAGFWTEDDRAWPTDAEDHLRTPDMKKARASSKEFFFSWLYGSGNTIRGVTLWFDGCLPEYTDAEYDTAESAVESRIVDMNDVQMFPLKKDKYILYDESLVLKTIYGKRISDTFLEKVDGIKELLESCKRESKSTGYITALDGRLLYSRSPHSALNLLLQGSAGVVAKRWMVNYTHLAHDRGLVTGVDYWQSAYIHDEFQCPCVIGKHTLLMQCLEEGAAQVGPDYDMKIPIKADAVFGSDWSKTH